MKKRNFSHIMSAVAVFFLAFSLFLGADAAESETYSQGQPQEQTEKTAHIVAIDPGHQGPGQDMSQTEPNAPGSDVMKARIVSGTQGSTTGLAESELNLSVALKLREKLEERGYEVVMTRTEQDVNLSNIDRASIAAEEGAEITVRIHANGIEDPTVSGALAMIPSAQNPYVGELYEDSLLLGTVILDSYCEATGLQNKGITETDTMTGINWSTMPVTILEMGFMTNAGDDLYMADEDHQEIMAEGIADGIDTYFSHKDRTIE